MRPTPQDVPSRLLGIFMLGFGCGIRGGSRSWYPTGAIFAAGAGLVGSSISCGIERDTGAIKTRCVCAAFGAVCGYLAGPTRLEARVVGADGPHLS
jgi:hypothetical protein